MSKTISKKLYSQNFAVCYLALKKFHILPIYGLNPELIKKSAKNVIQDREKISHCTILNSVVHCLGFKGGFSGYVDEYEKSLKPFMELNGLNSYENLITPKYPNEITLQHKRQDVSERIFFSSNSIPKHIFTGYNFRYDQHFDSGVRLFNSEVNLGDYGLTYCVDEENQSNNIDIAKSNPYLTVKINSREYPCRPLIDVVIGSEVIFIKNGFNLLGDQLVKPKLTNSVFQTYSSDEEYLDKCLIHYHKKLDLFVRRVDELNQGWVEVIPFNKHLIFLKGENGSFDFLIKNQKDAVFQHQIYAPYLKTSEIPKFDDEYHFKRWYYFEFEGNRQEQEHLSELAYYQNGGSVQNYPGEINLLKKSLNDQYKQTLLDLKSDIKLGGFHQVSLNNNKVLMVSNLISIQDLEWFKNLNSEYFQRRIKTDNQGRLLDNLDTVNADEDILAPAAVTFYDVLAYINWFNKRNHIETRLLSLDEYRELTPFAGSPFQVKNGLKFNQLNFYSPDGELIEGHPSYMSELDFQNLFLKYTKLEYQSKFNLDFVDSHSFAEWLLDKVTIRSNSLTSFDEDNSIIRTNTPFNSTGKYKRTKIGFRLCYELNTTV